MTTRRALLDLRSVRKTYGEATAPVPALRDVSLAVPEGQFLSIVGPSGCGKTTLLNLMAGLDTPDAGVVRVAGRRVDEMDERARSELRLRTVGLVFQSFHLLPGISVERNVAWRLELTGVIGAEQGRRVGALLERLGVPQAAWGRLPAKLSGGEQQRVALARALVTEPALLLADEPTGNLDSVTGESILDLLRELNRERGMTIVLVTHDSRAAARTDRVVALGDGRVRSDGAGPGAEGEASSATHPATPGAEGEASSATHPAMPGAEGSAAVAGR